MPESGMRYGMLSATLPIARLAHSPARPLSHIMSFLSTLGITHPIIQAPMAGANATPPALVAAVSNAGGLGFIGAAYMSPEQIVRESAAIRTQTEHPFGINLFAPVQTPSPPTAGELEGARAAIK